jgi:predicted AlkP superfamily pyrophosphatase or phosphodiesterase
MPNYYSSQVIMKQRFSFLLLAFLFSSGCKDFDINTEIRDNCQPANNVIKKVLFIGYDGCRTDAMLQANTPAIDSIMVHGFVNLHCDVGRYTQSVPSWASILHGVWANKHCSTSNEFGDENYTAYPDLFHYLKLANPSYSLATITHWGDFLRITSQEDYAQYVDSDAEVDDAAIDLLNTCTPDVLLLHFDDMDGAGHSSGFSPDNPEYIEAIEQNDAFTANIMEVIYEREQFLNEEWLVVLATDHGGIGTGHTGEQDHDEVRFTFLVVRVPGHSRIDLDEASNTDVMPTIFDYLDIEIQDSWELDGVSVF